jgi:hypothetical protein
LPDNSPCNSDSQCQGDVCTGSADNSVAFCTKFCTSSSECGDFVGGCCFPTDPGRGVCAPLAFCGSKGDAGVGDPCPQHTECASELICAFSSDNTVSVCTRPCDDKHGCGSAAQVCCEPIGAANNYDYCVIDNTCPTRSSTGSTGTTGTTGTTGSTGSTGTSGSTGSSPVTLTLTVDGLPTGTANDYVAVIGPTSDLFAAPASARNLQLTLPFDLPVGTYACADDGVAGPDGGRLYAGVTTAASLDGSPSPADNLPLQWRNLTFGLVCGPSTVSNAPDAVVDAVSLDITRFSPGQPRTVDGGARRGHLTGTARWQLHRGSSALVVDGRFDVDLTAP